MLTLNMHDAKSQLSRMVEQALLGEDVIIAKAGKPAVRLVPVEPLAPRAKRQLGPLRGQIWMAEDFDDTPQEVIDAFENGEIFPSEGNKA